MQLSILPALEGAPLTIIHPEVTCGCFQSRLRFWISPLSKDLIKSVGSANFFYFSGLSIKRMKRDEVLADYYGH